jgi:hypothetical protein
MWNGGDAIGWFLIRNKVRGRFREQHLEAFINGPINRPALLNDDDNWINNARNEFNANAIQMRLQEYNIIRRCAGLADVVDFNDMDGIDGLNGVVRVNLMNRRDQMETDYYEHLGKLPGKIDEWRRDYRNKAISRYKMLQDKEDKRMF